MGAAPPARRRRGEAARSLLLRPSFYDLLEADRRHREYQDIEDEDGGDVDGEV